MFLSFIVPVYNTERYLSECLDSLLTQDIDAHDYEIICVNDGSKDGSLEILREYARQYPNIKVIDKKNEGVATARNIGLDAAKGDFIWFVDSDDFVQANCLKQLFLCSEGACPDCIQMGAFAFHNTLSDEENALYKENRIAANSFANNVFVTRTLFRTDFIRKHGIEFHTELNYSEDKVFISEVLVQNPRIEVLEQAMFYYRYRSGSAITAGDLADENRKHKSWIIAVLLLKELYACSPMEHKAAIANNMMADYYAYMYSIAGMKGAAYSAAKEKLQINGLFPFHRPKECTLDRSYMRSGNSLADKAFDYVYIHQNTVVGFYIMRIIRAIHRFIMRQ